MPATAPADSPQLPEAEQGGGGKGRDSSGWAGSSVTRLPFTPQPDMASSTMSCGLAAWTWWQVVGRLGSQWGTRLVGWLAVGWLVSQSVSGLVGGWVYSGTRSVGEFVDWLVDHLISWSVG